MQNSGDGIGQRLCIGLCQKPVLLVRHDFANAVHRRRNACNLCRHRLEKDVWGTLIVGGEQEYVRGTDQLACVRNLADEAHTTLHADRGRVSFETVSLTKILTGDHRSERHVARKERDRIYEPVKILLRMYSSHAGDQQGLGRNAETGTPMNTSRHTPLIGEYLHGIWYEVDVLSGVFRSQDPCRPSTIANEPRWSASACPDPSLPPFLWKICETRIAEGSDRVNLSA
jgi:hypothetical protein